MIEILLPNGETMILRQNDDNTTTMVVFSVGGNEVDKETLKCGEMLHAMQSIVLEVRNEAREKEIQKRRKEMI